MGIYCRDESKFGRKLAFEWFEKAARQGHAEAQTNIGECYKEGLGVERNTQQAFYWFNEAAKKGVARARYYMGECYENGEGICKNFVKAEEYYRKAANQEYAEAQYRLGRCYELGKGVDNNKNMAAIWYEKAAKQGHIEAQYYLGKYYESRELWGSAIESYQKPAEQGDAEVQYRLGRCYEKNRQREKAMEWYKKSAEQGYAEGQYHYGYLLWMIKDYTFDMASEWFKMAADNPQPSVDACLRLANHYCEDMDEFFWGRNLTLLGGSILIPVANTITIPVAVASAIASRKLSKSHFLESDKGKEMIKYYQKAARLGSNEAQEKLKKLGYSW